MKTDTRYPKWDTEKAEARRISCTRGPKLLRQDVYKHNCEIFSAGGYISENGTAVEIPADDPMLKKTIVYSKEFKLAHKGQWTTTETCVENADCLKMAFKMIQEGYNPAVLNLADAYTACGFYSRGSSAQEESLCRASTLSRSLFQYYKARSGKADRYATAANVALKEIAYPLDTNFGGIYTPDAIVFRNSAKDLFTLMDKPYKVSFISLAALDFNEKHGKNLEYQLPCGGINSEGMEIMRNKIRTIYRIAATNCHDSMILGAFGCGAFRLPSATVASLFKEILNEEEFKGQFRAVKFAILHNDDSYSKFAPFYEIFG